MRIGVLEIVLILVLALILFGGKKLSGVGKALGQSIREFKDELGPDEKAKQEEAAKVETTDNSDFRA